MSDGTDILIIGFGAIGTIYGYILSQNENVRVTAIARSAYEAMESKGIRIESDKLGTVDKWKPYRIVQNPADANDRAYKYIVCCFKSVPDLVPSASILAPFLEGPFAPKGEKVNEGPAVVLIQNGLGIEHPIQVAYPRVPIISVVAWIGANLHCSDGEQPVVTHGMLENLAMGLYLGEGLPAGTGTDLSFADPGRYEQGGDGAERKAEGWRRTRYFEHLLTEGGSDVLVVDDIQPKRYEKNVWNAAWSSLCTLSRSPVSACVTPAVLAYTLPVVRRTMLEVIYIAREWGYSEDVLPIRVIDNAIKITMTNWQVRDEATTPGTPGVRADAFGGLGYGFPAPSQVAEEVGHSSPSDRANFKPSMLLDIEAGRPSELEPIIGSLLDRARAKGVETPRLDLVYASLKIQQDIACRRSAESESYKQHISDWLLRKPAVAGASLDGRREWEKAVRRAASERESEGIVQMANGKHKVTGKPVKIGSED